MQATLDQEVKIQDNKRRVGQLKCEGLLLIFIFNSSLYSLIVTNVKQMIYICMTSKWTKKVFKRSRDIKGQNLARMWFMTHIQIRRA